jgi:hypothetical protein
MFQIFTPEKNKLVKHRIKTNKSFKRRVEWYQLGQRRCHCCGVQMTWGSDSNPRDATVEHLVPASKGGTFHSVNIIVTCRSCNKSRQSTDWIDFVTKNKLPKAEWLIEKYLKALYFYKKTNVVLDMNLYSKANVYMARQSKEQVKKAA